jgi:hypothetical protein
MINSDKLHNFSIVTSQFRLVRLGPCNECPRRDVGISGPIAIAVWVEKRLTTRNPVGATMASLSAWSDLSYHGVRIDLLDRAVLGIIARDSQTEALYDEVDVFDDGVFVHRLLFWPYYREIHVVFSSLSIARMPSSDRPVDAMPDRYLR